MRRIRETFPQLRTGRVFSREGLEAAVSGYDAKFWKRDELKETAILIADDIGWNAGALPGETWRETPEKASRTQIGQNLLQEHLIRWIAARLAEDKAAQSDNESLPEPKAPESPPGRTESHSNGDTDIAGDLRHILERVGFTPKSGIDRAQVEAIVADLHAEQIAQQCNAVIAEWEKRQVTRVEVVRPETGEVVLQKTVHKQFAQVRKVVARNIPLMLVGPAGGGKTQLIEDVCDSLGRTFRATSFGPQTTQSELKGFMNATGNYVPSEMRKAFEALMDKVEGEAEPRVNLEGSVFLADEGDAGNAGVWTSYNAGLSNGGMGFPDRFVKKANGVAFVAAMNTFGRGCDRQYVGRNQLDAATLDRFVVIELEYDEALERQIALARNSEAVGWIEFVQKCRKAAFDYNAGKTGEAVFRHVISPRASLYGAELLLEFEWPEVEKMALWKGFNAAEVAKIKTLAGV